VTFEGTLRVDRSAPDGGPDNLIVSGDLYRRLPVVGPIVPTPPLVPRATGETEGTTSSAPVSVAGALSAGDNPALPLPFLKPRIPIFPRSRYHSYLEVTSVSAPLFAPIHTRCQLTIVADRFDYTHPPAGQFKGTFPNTPSRTVTMKLSRVTPPFPFSLTGGPFYEGRLFEGGVDKGSVTLGWVSKFFRRATLEVDTLTGAVRPTPVPDGAGGTEFFDTIFAQIGWQLSVVQDQLNIPVPPGVVPTNCWSSANLHALMTNDGYPSSDSSNFGAAENQMQRNVDYPASAADDNPAPLVMHADVGKWVALGGEAYHLGEAGRRLLALAKPRSARPRARRRLPRRPAPPTARTRKAR